MDDHTTRLLVKVAQLYHLQGLNQDQIGRQLGVSRSKVSRMLKEARERGLVEISIHYPARSSLELERRLEAALGLREAVVVQAGGDLGRQSDGAYGAVAGAAAAYLLRVLQPGDMLGVSGGETVAMTARVMPPSVVEGVSVAQLGAAIPTPGGGTAYSSAEVALQFAQKLGGMDRLALIPIPSLLDTETIRDALLLDTGVQHVMALLAHCTIALVGIGTVETLTRTVEGPRGAGAGARRRCHRRLLRVTDEEITELRSAGAVGEICARFFDVNGRPCGDLLGRRMIGLDLDQLRAAPQVIGVATGPQKAAAILGAARGGYVKSLVTDDQTALAVLALVAASTGAGAHAYDEPGIGAQTARPHGRDTTNQTEAGVRRAGRPGPHTTRSHPDDPTRRKQQTSGPGQLAHG